MKQQVKFAKRQHFIPEMLQKRFEDGNGLLWFYDRRRGEVGSTGAGNLFVQTHLYTLEDADGGRHGTIENILSRVETETEPVFDKIISRARSRKTPALTDQERWALILYLFLQYRRVPEFIDNVPHEQTVSEQLRDIVDELEAERGPLPDDVRTAYLGQDLAKRLEQNFKALGVMGEIQTSRSFMGFNARGVSVALVDHPGTGFVLGSSPFMRSSADGRTDLGHPGVELWLPIAPDVAVGLAGSQHQSRVLLVGKGRTVEEMNQGISDMSTTVASPSRYQIERLAHRMGGPVPPRGNVVGRKPRDRAAATRAPKQAGRRDRTA